MKGASAIVASVMLVLIAVVASVFVSGWLSSTTEKQTGIIRNNTLEQIQCQYADLYVRGAVYDCGGNCAAGTAHTVNLTVVNSGKRALYMDRLFITNTTGSVMVFRTAAAVLDVGGTIYLANTTTDSCSGINRSIEYMRVGSTNCPTAYDNFEGSRVTYSNC